MVLDIAPLNSVQ